MRHYEPSTPRAAAALTAVAMAAITLGSLVVLPARFDAFRVDPYEMEAKSGRAVVDVAIGPVRSEATVVAERGDAVRTDRMALAAKGSAGKRQPWNSRGRTHT